MLLYYTPNLSGNTAVLSEEESHHCVKVLRKRVGDTIHITDGKGMLCEAKLTDANREACVVDVVEVHEHYGKRDFHLHIAIAPTKNNTRFEWFLEKATEIGVDEITPVICENSERKKVNTERANKVLVSALKQSQRTYLPKLNNIVTLEQFLSGSSISIENSDCFIASYSPQNEEFATLAGVAKNCLILVGPEGDFSEAELKLAGAAGFKAVNLGKARLRTETAGVLVCGIFSMLST